MPKNRVSVDQNSGVYFLTPTVWNWYYVFDRHHRWEILADSIRYCQEHKGLRVHAYVFMLNHLHLIIQADDVAGVLRDFKRHTAKKLLENIAETEPNLLSLFMRDNGVVFWKEDNQPRLIETEAFYRQKLEYIIQNPVRKRYVVLPEHWYWSSANSGAPLSVEHLW
jgi:REP element-mobilizing transposase RayT